MRNALIVAILALFLVGCSSTPKVKSIEVVTKPIEKLKLNIDTPPPVILQDVNWVIVTEDNISAVWESLKKDNKGVALFALKDDELPGIGSVRLALFPEGSIIVPLLSTNAESLA